MPRPPARATAAAPLPEDPAGGPRPGAPPPLARRPRGGTPCGTSCHCPFPCVRPRRCARHLLAPPTIHQADAGAKCTPGPIKKKKKKKKKKKSTASQSHFRPNGDYPSPASASQVAGTTGACLLPAVSISGVSHCACLPVGLPPAGGLSVPPTRRCHNKKLIPPSVLIRDGIGARPRPPGPALPLLQPTARGVLPRCVGARALPSPAAPARLASPRRRAVSAWGFEI